MMQEKQGLVLDVEKLQVMIITELYRETTVN